MTGAPVTMSYDFAARRHFALLAALLDHDDPPWRRDEVPPLGHWLLFPPDERQSALGADGHPERADSGLPRRMWAGSRIRFHAPIAIGAAVSQATTTGQSRETVGRSGRLRLTTLLKRVCVGSTLLVEEEQDLVFREAPGPGPFARPPADAVVGPATAVRRVMADPAALFRFSALTFNAHRIHYDREYATGVEGYPGLVVQGPYIATLLMDHFLRHRPGARVTAFEFRALRPVFDREPFTLELADRGPTVDLRAIDADGGIAMQASVAAI